MTSKANALSLDRVEELLAILTTIVDQPIYANTARLVLCRTLAITSLHYAAAARSLCNENLAMGAAVVLRSQFEALVRSVWVHHQATDSQVDKLSQELSIESQQANKNIPHVAEMLADLEKHESLRNLLISLNEFKGSAWQPLNSFVHSGIHAIYWTKWQPPINFIEQIFRNSNGLAVLAYQNLAILTGQPLMQRKIIAATAAFSSCLPARRA